MEGPVRADQVGSFLRPAELLAARQADGDAAALRALEDRHIRRVFAKQEELGVDVFTDGEFRRRNFMSDLTDAVEGFDLGDAVSRSWQGAGTRVASVTGIVVEKLRQVRRLTAHEVDFIKAHSPGRFKMTLPSSNQFPAIAFKRGITDHAYRDHSALLWDIAPIIRDEVAALAASGVPYVQIDAPRYSYYIDPKWRTFIQTEMGMAPDAALDEAIRADNTAFAAGRAAADGVTLAIHLCRGNNRSQWYAEGGYDPIAEKLFNTLEVDRFLLEYDDERSGTFEPLRFVPQNKTVVLGLVSSKKPSLESPREIIRRIEEAAKYVPLDRLALSPQCGFASVMEGNLLTEEDQWAKLRLVVDTARTVWQ